MGYTLDTLAGLILTEPNGSVEPVANLDDAIKQVKRYLKNELGKPDTSGDVFDAIAASAVPLVTPVGTVSSYADGTEGGTWAAPTNYLKCDGNTIGSADSGAAYASDDYEDLFNLIKDQFGNAGDEDWANDDTVKLPKFVTEKKYTGAEKSVSITSTTDNGGSLTKEVAIQGNEALVTNAADFTVDNFTLHSSAVAPFDLLGLDYVVYVRRTVGNQTYEVVTANTLKLNIEDTTGVNGYKGSVNLFWGTELIQSNGSQVDFTVKPLRFSLPALTAFSFTTQAFTNKSDTTFSNAEGVFGFTLQNALVREYQTINFIIRAK